jgi:hypothetical protein
MRTISKSLKPAEPVVDFDRVSAEAQKLRQDSGELILRSQQLSAQSATLRQWWQGYHRKRARPQPYVAVAKSDRTFVASARRVPWRRLQFEEMQGVIEWNAPDYAPL